MVNIFKADIKIVAHVHAVICMHAMLKSSWQILFLSHITLLLSLPYYLLHDSILPRIQIILRAITLRAEVRAHGVCSSVFLFFITFVWLAFFTLFFLVVYSFYTSKVLCVDIVHLKFIFRPKRSFQFVRRWHNINLESRIDKKKKRLWNVYEG